MGDGVFADGHEKGDDLSPGFLTVFHVEHQLKTRFSCSCTRIKVVRFDNSFSLAAPT